MTNRTTFRSEPDISFCILSNAARSARRQIESFTAICIHQRSRAERNEFLQLSVRGSEPKETIGILVDSTDALVCQSLVARNANKVSIQQSSHTTICRYPNGAFAIQLSPIDVVAGKPRGFIDEMPAVSCQSVQPAVGGKHQRVVKTFDNVPCVYSIQLWNRHQPVAIQSRRPACSSRPDRSAVVFKNIANVIAWQTVCFTEDFGAVPIVT